MGCNSKKLIFPNFSFEPDILQVQARVQDDNQVIDGLRSHF